MSKDYKYPILLKSISSGRTVLMTERGVGTIVGTGQSGNDRMNYRIGYYSDDWSMYNFKPFKEVMADNIKKNK